MSQVMLFPPCPIFTPDTLAFSCFSNSPGYCLPQGLNTYCSLCQECSSAFFNVADPSWICMIHLLSAPPPVLSILIYIFPLLQTREACGEKKMEKKTQKRSLWRSDMTKVTQLVMRTAQKCWNPSCPQNPSSQPPDQSSQYTFVLHACSSLCPTETTGTLLSQQNSRPHLCVIMCVSHSRQQGPCLSLIFP